MELYCPPTAELWNLHRGSGCFVQHRTQALPPVSCWLDILFRQRRNTSQGWNTSHMVWYCEGFCFWFASKTAVGWLNHSDSHTTPYHTSTSLVLQCVQNSNFRSLWCVWFWTWAGLLGVQRRARVLEFQVSCCPQGHGRDTRTERIGVFILAGRRQNFWRAGVKVNMTPNGEHQIIGPDRSQIFDAGINFLSLRHQCENP